MIRRIRDTPGGSPRGGWWVVDDADIGDAARSDAATAEIHYGFAIDGRAPVADPRSVWLPDGVHGLGRLHRLGHRWSDADWTGRPVRGAVLYELHVGTFTPGGTLDSAIDRLDHLVSLGVDMVELMPVNAFNGPYGWGYDGVAWYAVHEPYGGPEALARFVDACHGRNLGVVLDVVYNHLGPSGNHLPDFGPYLGDGDTTWGSSVNLAGPDSDEVRDFIIANALWWFRDVHVDALRLDAVHALTDTRALHLLEELAAETDRLATELGRPLSLIAESDLNDPRLITPRSQGGYGLSAQWADDIHHALHATVSGEGQGYYADFTQAGALSKVLRHGFFHDGIYSSFRGRTHGRPIPPDIPASALVASTCTHDQIGNRASGDRPGTYLDDGLLAAKAALILLSPFTPMLFMGEEWGARTPFAFFSSHPEPELAHATREGRRAEFADHGWTGPVSDPQDPSTFALSHLNWDDLHSPAHRRVHDFYRALIALHKHEPDFRRDDFDSVTTDEGPGWLAMHRGDWTVLMVHGDDPVPLPDGLDVELCWHTPMMSSDGATISAGHNVVVGRRHHRQAGSPDQVRYS